MVDDLSGDQSRDGTTRSCLVGLFCANRADEEKETSDLSFDELIPLEFVLAEIDSEQDQSEDALEPHLVDRHVHDRELISQDSSARVVCCEGPEKWRNEASEEDSKEPIDPHLRHRKVRVVANIVFFGVK